MLYGDDGSPLDYSNVFLPAVYQGTRLGDARTPVKESKIGYLTDPSCPVRCSGSISTSFRRAIGWTRRSAARTAISEGLIQSYELAFRMQMEAPSVFDLAKESKQTLDLYGVGEKETDNFGRKCLMARRLAEAGVRYIQVTDNGWDHHAKIGAMLRKSAKGIDKPLAGFLTDMKARGLLEDTLVIWTGEFGRTPYDQSAAGAKDDTQAGPQPVLLDDVDDRCRCKAGHRAQRQMSTPGKQLTVRCMSTIYTRPYCTCWGSITRN